MRRVEIKGKQRTTNAGENLRDGESYCTGRRQSGTLTVNIRVIVH